MVAHRTPQPGMANQRPIRVIEVRGVHVVLDFDVARLFSVDTRKLNQQVNRNKPRFGDDFAFRLTKDEARYLRSQDVIPSSDWGGPRYPPFAFTEHGVVMAATVLRSKTAIEAAHHIVRTFVALRRGTDELAFLPNNDALVDKAGEASPSHRLSARLNAALGHVLDAMVDPAGGLTVREEAKAVAAEGIKSLKAYLRRPGIKNDRTRAELRQIMAEAESIEVETVRKRTENQHRQLALLAKKLRLLLQAQHYAQTGSVEGLLVVLSDLEGNGHRQA